MSGDYLEESCECCGAEKYVYVGEPFSLPKLPEGAVLRMRKLNPLSLGTKNYEAEYKACIRRTQETLARLESAREAVIEEPREVSAFYVLGLISRLEGDLRGDTEE